MSGWVKPSFKMLDVIVDEAPPIRRRDRSGPATRAAPPPARQPLFEDALVHAIPPIRRRRKSGPATASVYAPQLRAAPEPAPPEQGLNDWFVDKVVRTTEAAPDPAAEGERVPVLLAIGMIAAGVPLVVSAGVLGLVGLVLVVA